MVDALVVVREVRGSSPWYQVCTEVILSIWYLYSLKNLIPTKMKRNAALLVLSSAASALELSGHCGGRRAIVSAGLAAVTSSAPLAAIAASRENLDSVSTQTPLPAEAPSGEQQFVTLPSGLKYKEIKKGSGDVVRQGDTVAIQYTGRLLNLNGKKFASTFDGVAPGGLPEPLVFTVGEREVIPGLEELVLGMSKGGYRRGLVPPALGYDQAISLGPKPANFQDARSLDAVVKNPNRDATLIWDVQLERVRRK